MPGYSGMSLEHANVDARMEEVKHLFVNQG